MTTIKKRVLEFVQWLENRGFKNNHRKDGTIAVWLFDKRRFTLSPASEWLLIWMNRRLEDDVSWIEGQISDRNSIFEDKYGVLRFHIRTAKDWRFVKSFALRMARAAKHGQDMNLADYLRSR